MNGIVIGAERAVMPFKLGQRGKHIRRLGGDGGQHLIMSMHGGVMITRLWH